jgi:hypothetical protein
MKTIAYSEVPAHPHSYVHLAYVSASSEPTAAALGTGILIAVTYLFVYLVGAAAKLNVKFPRFWRVATVAVIAVTGCLTLVGILFGRVLEAGL